MCPPERLLSITTNCPPLHLSLSCSLNAPCLTAKTHNTAAASSTHYPEIAMLTPLSELIGFAQTHAQKRKKTTTKKTQQQLGTKEC